MMRAGALDFVAFFDLVYSPEDNDAT